MSKPMEKTIFEQRSKCPYCSRPIHTRVVRVTVKETVKGETKIEGFLEKDTQSSLKIGPDDTLDNDERLLNWVKEKHPKKGSKEAGVVKKQVARKKW